MVITIRYHYCHLLMAAPRVCSGSGGGEGGAPALRSHPEGGRSPTGIRVSGVDPQSTGVVDDLEGTRAQDGQTLRQGEGGVRAE